MEGKVDIFDGKVWVSLLVARNRAVATPADI